MWAVRAAVRPRAWFARALRRVPAPPPWPTRARAAFGPGGRAGGGGGGRDPGARGRAGTREEEPDGAGEEELEEEEELLRGDPLLPPGAHRVCLVHPEAKGAPAESPPSPAEWRVAEAEALVRTLDGWSVADTVVAPAKTAGRKLVFGRGTLEHLTRRSPRPLLSSPLSVAGRAGSPRPDKMATWGSRSAQLALRAADPTQHPGQPWSRPTSRTPGRGHPAVHRQRIRRAREVTAVFLNAEKLAKATQRELEAAWGVPVIDRFALVLHVFRCNARSREARLQVALAELPVLRSNLESDVARPQGRGSRYLMGSGESFMQVQRRLFREKETKLQRALERLRGKRRLLCRQRARRELPVVSVVGYTNCGKTTLVKALTGDAAMQPRDQLFATLDVTAHAGALPCGLTVLYVDTVGFLSQLPHSLVAAFSATLDDVAQSDLVVHVRDVSHPESELQKATVLSTLRDLRLPAPLLASVLEVHNKADRLPGYTPREPNAVAVSALLGHGLPELKARLEDAVLTATGRRALTLRVRLEGPQLSWLHEEATVQDVRVLPEGGAAEVTVVISGSAYGRFQKLFPE
ncbi:putative GTP-binding protein 6 [Galemys pyrenaicus]|uniref:Putative GTP-binding protein 6 n=1 Tax=Galemys pyrenaicus TaxID=202257 RepID=A0A8J6AJP5_GALPY|nr:putative GTP-binding protein 6 [Galemys pyrenaicus]